MPDENSNSLDNMADDSDEIKNEGDLDPSEDISSPQADQDTDLGPQQETDLTMGSSKSKNLDLILDIPLVVTVELGRTKMLINDLLQLGQGSVIELAKLVGEPLEILVNEKLVARGEVVVVNEKFGVRLTDIVSPMERIENLGDDE